MLDPRIKVLFVREYNACNTPYLLYCLQYLKKRFLINFTEVRVSNYLEMDQNSYDIVIYATYPNETTNKFNQALITQTDEKFLGFKGAKILFDSHANGLLDGFVRFRDISLPRIKTAPHKKIVEQLNVILATTHPMGTYPKSPAYKYVGPFPMFPKSIIKDVEISCRVTLGKNENYRSQIRSRILNELAEYKGSQSIDTEYKKKDPNYKKYLARVLISVCPPGHGPGSFRHLETLNAKSLMFSHDSISDVKLLPNAELVEGEDYVAFNLDNMTEKLDIILADRERVKQISERGYKKFSQGYSVGRYAIKLYRTLKEYV